MPTYSKSFCCFIFKYSNAQKDEYYFYIYLLQWNAHGYDIAKTFPKFTMISPVWLQIKRKPRGKYHITGTHDIDKGASGFIVVNMNIIYCLNELNVGYIVLNMKLVFC